MDDDGKGVKGTRETADSQAFDSSEGCCQHLRISTLTVLENTALISEEKHAGPRTELVCHRHPADLRKVSQLHPWNPRDGIMGKNYSPEFYNRLSRKPQYRRLY